MTARLFNLAPRIAPERRFSRVHRGRRELLDQILASVACFPLGDHNERRLPAVDSHIDVAGQLVSVAEDPSARAQELAPDHAPVTATLEF